MDNRQISDLPHAQWLEYKHENHAKLFNQYPDYDHHARHQVMRDFKTILEEQGITLFLANGALLGAYREGDFIAWDDDVDMDVLAEEIIPKQDAVREKLVELGYIVRVVKEHNRGKINVHYAGEKVGIVYLYSNGPIRYRQAWKWPNSLYENREKITFKGVEFTAPSIEKYLIHQYGEDWATPKTENYFSEDLYR